MANDEEAVAEKTFLTFLRNGERDAFLQLEAELLGQSVEKWGALVAAYRSLLTFDDIAAEAGLDERFRPKIWWMRSPFPGNFGDILTPYVLWHAFGVMPRWYSSKQADGLCIGSIAKFARPGMHLWGTGMPRSTDDICPTAIYAAVRGPLSREAVLAAGGQCPEIYGDAAILLPELYAPVVEKTHTVGIIAHVLQEARIRQAVEAVGADHVKVISLLAVSFEDIERVIREILSCEEIVTTSLHGLIVAHAYGVPAQSARLAEGKKEAKDSFKMRDYKQSVGLSDEALELPRTFDDLAWLDRRACVLPPSPLDTKPLRAAFPFPVRFREPPAARA
ncbi:polysaccharide pyruvyl transferase family protein [Methylobacterium sp. E-045]|uniref:polysaccharide pyruvyl transferase family protein n=1 Tax=Methylobacterium sp. E-045 TaxID=2836575 RepID=UPI001FB9F9D0|nr:polysaccharide pyruvyl transferase family protein [Methylobacterium sp. E-045]MCJ2129867.1 polysaccharide pyruvyl transferase family protein [Methylobacterium sp. E-045]